MALSCVSRAWRTSWGEAHALATSPVTTRAAKLLCFMIRSPFKDIDHRNSAPEAEISQARLLLCARVKLRPRSGPSK